MSNGLDNYFLRYDSGKQGKWSWIASADRTETDIIENADGTSQNLFGRRDNFNLEGTYDLADNTFLDVSVDILREDLKGRQTATGELRAMTGMIIAGTNTVWDCAAS